jgi:putative phosphoribosyl transferase
MTRIMRRVRYPFAAFRDREEAGERLAEFAGPEPDDAALVLALPRGGVPVAGPLAGALGCPLEPVFVRKLPIPASPEMGFGAVASDGSTILNDAVVRAYGVSAWEVGRLRARVMEELRRRAREYSGSLAPPAVAGRAVWLVDDGLATGYTMMAAAEMARRGGPEKLVLAVPVSPADSLRRLEPYFDETHCLIAQDRPSFAVASYYGDFHDMSDAEVREVLARRRATVGR